MNNRGQALVEFILILPVILIALVVLVELGNIFVQKINLNNSMTTVTRLYQNEQKEELENFISKENIEFSAKEVDDMVELTLKKKIKVSVPILNRILGSNYVAEAKQTIYKGEKDAETQ